MFSAPPRLCGGYHVFADSSAGASRRPRPLW